ncbi:hypothetical protein TURU_124169 [Turdus rufiventris]|nr:hypothetical protein TURU_124169 [Turdus rufiventris]
MLLLLLPAVVLEQATLGTAGMDKQALPDLGALSLQPKPKKCAFLQELQSELDQEPNLALTYNKPSQRANPKSEQTRHGPTDYFHHCK